MMVSKQAKTDTQGISAQSPKTYKALDVARKDEAHSGQVFQALLCKERKRQGSCSPMMELLLGLCCRRMVHTV